jgi:hypothetical protein
MANEEVLEVAGVKAHRADDRSMRQNIIVDEVIQGGIRIGGFYCDLLLEPAEARRLARQLYRFARRAEQRNAK